MSPSKQGVMSYIRANVSGLSPSQRLVADYVAAHPEQAVEMSLLDIAKAAKVSDATVMRFVRDIGFTGFSEFKIALSADLMRLPEAIFEEVDADDDIAAITRKVFIADIQLLQDTLNVLQTEKMEELIEKIEGADNIYLFGVGTSAPLAQWLYDRLFRLGYRVEAVTDAYLQLVRSALVGAKDLIIVISRSGTPATMIGALDIIKNAGTPTVALTCDPNSPIARKCELVLSGVTREIRRDLPGSPVSLSAIIDVIYTCLEVRHPHRSMDNQRRVYDALDKLRES